MRVSDNLEQNTSSFYAELLRINRGISTTKNAMYLIKMIGIDD